jgi:type IV pilus assembly protein PilM
MLARKVWGLDLGRSAVKGVLLSSTASGVEILDCAIVPLEGEPPDPSQEPIRDGRLWRALRVFRDAHPVGTTELCVAIPAQNTLVRDLSVAAVGTRKLDELVRYEASNEIPFVLDDVVWDYSLFDAKPGEATRSGLLFAVKKNVIQTYVRVFVELGLGHLDRITLAPLALLNFVSLQLEEGASALALDVGGENTNMLAVHEGAFWLRNMLTGGNRVTDLLKQEFDLGFAEAERAKENILRSKHAREIMAAVTPAVHDLVRNVKTNLSYVERTVGQGAHDRTYLVGGGARLPGVRKQLGSTLRLEIQNVSELKHLTVSPKTDIEFVRSNLDRLAVAIGAALAGTGQDAAGVTFLPKSEARAARISRSRGLLMAAGIAVWLIMLTLWVVSLWVGRDIRPQLLDYRELAVVHHNNTQELAQARDTRAEEEALQYLMAASAARKQACRTLDGVVRAFSQANRASRYRFHIVSYDCVDQALARDVTAAQHAPEETVDDLLAGPLPEIEEEAAPVLSGSIKGRIVVPRGGAYGEAYTKFLTDLLGALRAQPELIKLTGQAALKKGSRSVESTDAEWLEIVKPDDVIRVLPGGQWCTIADVPSNLELTLAQPYGAEDAEGEVAIARVLLANFNEETLEFDIHFEVLREEPPGLLSLLDRQQEL